MDVQARRIFFRILDTDTGVYWSAPDGRNEWYDKATMIRCFDFFPPKELEKPDQDEKVMCKACYHFAEQHIFVAVRLEYEFKCESMA